MEFTEVEGPNSKAFSVLFPEIPSDFETFQRLNVAKADFEAVSGFLKQLGKVRRDLKHVDALRTKGGLLLTMSAALPWKKFLGSDPKAKPREVLRSWNGQLILDTSNVKSAFNVLPTINSERKLPKIVLSVLDSDDIQQKLAEDAGDIILYDVPYDEDTNSFHVEFLLMGGCAGCNRATTHTLVEIKRRIEIEFNEVVLTAPEGHPLKTMEFRGIQTKDLEGSFYQPRLVT